MCISHREIYFKLQTPGRSQFKVQMSPGLSQEHMIRATLISVSKTNIKQLIKPAEHHWVMPSSPIRPDFLGSKQMTTWLQTIASLKKYHRLHAILHATHHKGLQGKKEIFSLQLTWEFGSQERACRPHITVCRQMRVVLKRHTNSPPVQDARACHLLVFTLSAVTLHPSIILQLKSGHH